MFLYHTLARPFRSSSSSSFYETLRQRKLSQKYNPTPLAVLLVFAHARAGGNASKWRSCRERERERERKKKRGLTSSYCTPPFPFSPSPNTKQKYCDPQTTKTKYPNLKIRYSYAPPPQNMTPKQRSVPNSSAIPPSPPLLPHPCPHKNTQHTQWAPEHGCPAQHTSSPPPHLLALPPPVLPLRIHLKTAATQPKPLSPTHPPLRCTSHFDTRPESESKKIPPPHLHRPFSKKNPNNKQTQTTTTTTWVFLLFLFVQFYKILCHMRGTPTTLFTIVCLPAHTKHTPPSSPSHGKR